jgi:hypothetical protein
MDALLGLLMLVYPLALPAVTLAALAFVALAIRQSLHVVVVRALFTVPLLALFLAPGVDSTDGTFLMPWWLLVAIGDSDRQYYPFAYVLVCLLGLLFLMAGVVAWRAVGRNLARRQGRNKPNMP